jgi:hypothetical protein
VVGIDQDAIYGTHFRALRCLKMPDTLCAQLGVNFVDLVALMNGLVGALGLANIAIDAVIGDI